MCNLTSNNKAKAAVVSSFPGADKKGWQSSYKPLEKNAPALPTIGEIRASIPAECFHRSYAWSFFYLARDVAMSGAVAFVASQCMSSVPPSDEEGPVAFMLWVLGWSLYIFSMGTVSFGLWVLGHDCGHGSFSPSQTVNDMVGFVVHHIFLFPYFAWQSSHAKHHRRCNHITEGTSHVPSTKERGGLPLYAKIGHKAFATFLVLAHLFVALPFYLLGVESLTNSGSLAQDGTPLNGRMADHFRPYSPLFPPKDAPKIFV